MANWNIPSDIRIKQPRYFPPGETGCVIIQSNYRGIISANWDIAFYSGVQVGPVQTKATEPYDVAIWKLKSLHHHKNHL